MTQAEDNDRSEHVRNVVTGGGDYAEGDIDKRSGVFVSGGTVQVDVIGQQTTIVAAGLTVHDRDIRRRMLATVRTSWVEGVLDQSLYQELLLALNLQSEPGASGCSGKFLTYRRSAGVHNAIANRVSISDRR
jgi:hypothetical protein